MAGLMKFFWPLYSIQVLIFCLLLHISVGSQFFCEMYFCHKWYVLKSAALKFQIFPDLKPVWQYPLICLVFFASAGTVNNLILSEKFVAKKFQNVPLSTQTLDAICQFWNRWNSGFRGFSGRHFSSNYVMWTFRCYFRCFNLWCWFPLLLYDIFKLFNSLLQLSCFSLIYDIA